MDLDLIERCRAGDPASLAALQAIWGPRALAVAVIAGANDAAARTAVTDAFERAWQQLPAQHSRTAFRPWFLGLVVRTALGEAPASDPDVAALLAGARGADDAARRLLSRAPSWLPSWPSSAPPAQIEPVHALHVEMPASIHATFTALRDAARVPVWLPGARIRGRRPLEPGTRFPVRSAAWRARALVVAVEADRRIAFTLAVHVRATGHPIEMRFAIELRARDDRTEVDYALRGVAAPPSGLGRAGRTAAQIAAQAPEMMELGLGRLDAVLRQGAAVAP